MAYINEHSAKIASNLNFIEYKRVDLDDGVVEIFGRESGGEWVSTGFRFDKDKFTTKEAQDFLVVNDIKYIEMVEAVAHAKAELTDVNVQLISALYGDAMPSNRQPFILKVKMKKEGTDVNRQILCKLVSKDKKKGIGTFIAMKGNYSDTDKEFYSNITTEKSAHEFLILKGASNVSDVNHNLKVDKDIYLIESWTDKSDPDSWEWRVKLDFSRSEEMMKNFDDLTGVSIYAYVSVIEKSKGVSKMLEGLKGLLAKIKSMKLNKAETADNFNLSNKIDQIYNAIWSFSDAIVGYDSDEGGYIIRVDSVEKLEENITDISNILNEVIFESQKSKNKEMDIMTEDEKKNLKDEIVKDLGPVIAESIAAGFKAAGKSQTEDPAASAAKTAEGVDTKTDEQKQHEADLEVQKKKTTDAEDAKKKAEDDLEVEKLKRKSNHESVKSDEVDQSLEAKKLKYKEAYEDVSKWDDLNGAEKVEAARMKVAREI